MKPLPHHDLHAAFGGVFAELNNHEVVADYGDSAREFDWLTTSAGVIDLSFRGRICLLGDDRIKFLHGQVTNDIRRLGNGQGCYAALTDNKGRIQSDLNVHLLADELLLDFEPGYAGTVTERLERFMVADDVELFDVGESFGLISVLGPRAAAVYARLNLGELPAHPHDIVATEDTTLGQLYIANHARLGAAGFDCYIPEEALPAVHDKMVAAAKAEDGGAVGWEAFETARIVAAIPRYGQDMTDANLAPEAALEERAISYNKGCYIGQEVLNRVHNFAQLSKKLRPLRFTGERLPAPGDDVTCGGKKAGTITSAVRHPANGMAVGLGYVRKEFGEAGLSLEGEGFAANVV